MSSKIIITTTLLLLFTSFSALFAIEAKNHDPDYKKSWSVVYFENPQGDSLDFAIENHQGEKTNYKYKLALDGKEEMKTEVEIEQGAQQRIAPVIENKKLDKSKKVEIVVSFEDMEYRIYKTIQ